MNPADNYLALNRHSWNTKTDIHIKSDFYDVAGFLNGKNSLNDIELSLLGDLKGKSILHLQCHFGQDSISLSRLGAAVTGVDFSDVAIHRARQLAEEADARVNFICCDIYTLRDHLEGQFDIVFTSYGVIGWLPDLNKWAQVISTFLKPGGALVFVEFHPFLWMYDSEFEKIAYSYFNAGAIIETEAGSYTDRAAEITATTIAWNHSLSEVMNSLIQNKLAIRSFDEYDYSPYNCFNKAIEYAPKKYRIAHLGEKIPMVYAISAYKE
jgi:2-polyprenyl-3-methyl-5-hydroxy-6-metoxy-1,4-benzoquinol methylase